MNIENSIFYLKQVSESYEEKEFVEAKNAIDFAIEFLERSEHKPTVNIEQKKGKWMPHPTEREWDVCSACGIGCKRREYEMQLGQERMTEHSYQYCPNCGAKME
jgi:hypothetical protein